MGCRKHPLDASRKGCVYSSCPLKPVLCRILLGMLLVLLTNVLCSFACLCLCFIFYVMRLLVLLIMGLMGRVYVSFACLCLFFISYGMRLLVLLILGLMGCSKTSSQCVEEWMCTCILVLQTQLYTGFCWYVVIVVVLLTRVLKP